MSKLLKQSTTIATPPPDSLPVAGGSGIGTCRPGKPASASTTLSIITSKGGE